MIKPNFSVSVHKIPLAASEHSLIGVNGYPPHTWANYFSFYVEGVSGLESGSLRCLNFWYENAQGAISRFCNDRLIRVRVWGWKTPKTSLPCRVCIVDDARIPDNWYYNKLCFTGWGYPPTDVVRDIYNHLGDPTNELERFTNPLKYHERRGGVYNEKTGTIHYKITSDTSKLVTNLKDGGIRITSLPIATVSDGVDCLSPSMAAVVNKSIQDDINKGTENGSDT